jgi:hypothetical protein
MALVLNDRVQQTGTANTTVSFTLSGAVIGFQSFTAGVGNGNTTYYAAFDASGNWETGLGTFSTTGPTLTRTTVYQSSNSNLGVTFSGTVNVFVSYVATKNVNQDTLNTAYAGQMGASNGIFINNRTIATSYTIPTGYSASSTGPLTLNSGVSVTVPSGAKWVVL